MDNVMRTRKLENVVKTGKSMGKGGQESQEKNISVYWASDTEQRKAYELTGNTEDRTRRKSVSVNAIQNGTEHNNNNNNVIHLSFVAVSKRENFFKFTP